MSRFVLFNGSVIVRPGAATKIDASQFEDVTLGGNGIVAIVGEADDGPPHEVQVFGGGEGGVAAIKEMYRAGNIVEAAAILSNPSNDDHITTGAQQIVVYKINSSLGSSLTKAPHVFKSLGYGLQTNMATMVLAAGSTVNERVVTINFLDALGNKLQEVSPSLGATAKFVMAYVGAGSACTLTISSTTLTTAVTGGPGGEGLSLTFSDFRSLQEIIASIDANAAYTASALVTNVGSFDPSYLDPTTTVPIKARTGSTASNAAGAAAVPLQMRLTGLTGMAATDVGQWITLSGANSPGNNGTFQISVYTSATSVDVYNSGAVVPDTSNGAIAWTTGSRYNYALNFDLLDWINANSSIVYDDTAAYTKGQAAPIAVFAETGLTGGTKGTASVNDWIDAFAALATTRINQVVPLASTNLDVIVGGSPAGTELDAMVAALAAHCKLMSSTAGRSEREGWVGLAKTKAQLKTAAQAQNMCDVVVTGQQIQRLKIVTGEIDYLPEWGFACALAGMRAGAPLNEPLTRKIVNAFAITQDSSWSDQDSDDIAELTLNGVTTAAMVKGQGVVTDKVVTTYTKSDNDAFAEEIIVQIWKNVAYELRKAIEKRVVGRPGTKDFVSSIPSLVQSVCSKFEAEGALTKSVVNGQEIPAYRNITVRLTGDRMFIGVTITPTPGINYALITIALVPASMSFAA